MPFFYPTQDPGVKLKLVLLSDGSYEASKCKAQGADMIVACADRDAQLIKKGIMLEWLSKKPARMCKSSMGSEVHAQMRGVERMERVNELATEALSPSDCGLRALARQAESGQLLLPCDTVTDCDDLCAATTQPTYRPGADDTLQVYIAALREDQERRRLRHRFWVDASPQTWWRIS